MKETTYTPSKSTAAKIEVLAAATVAVDSAAIETAKKEIAEANAKAAVEKAKEELREIEKTRENQVEELREYRRYAKEHEIKLGKLIDAENAYLKTGDFDTYRKVRREVRGW